MIIQRERVGVPTTIKFGKELVVPLQRLRFPLYFVN